MPTRQHTGEHVYLTRKAGASYNNPSNSYLLAVILFLTIQMMKWEDGTNDEALIIFFLVSVKCWRVQSWGMVGVILYDIRHHYCHGKICIFGICKLTKLSISNNIRIFSDSWNLTRLQYRQSNFVFIIDLYWNLLFLTHHGDNLQASTWGGSWL